MSLNKGIEHGKEHRKHYYGSGRFDPTCRPNGSCPWCKGNRTHSNRLRADSAREESLDWEVERLEAPDAEQLPFLQLRL